MKIDLRKRGVNPDMISASGGAAVEQRDLREDLNLVTTSQQVVDISSVSSYIQLDRGPFS